MLDKGRIDVKTSVKRKNMIKQDAREYFSIVLGTVFMALAVNLVFEPIGMVTGGVSGLAIVIQELSLRWGKLTIPVWFSNLAINIPIFLAAWRIKGKRYLQKAFFANLCFSAALFLIPEMEAPGQDYLLASVVGSVLNGVGLGLIFSWGASTGGTDLLSAILQHYFPYYSVSRILFFVDSIVIIAGAWVFGIYTAVYAVIAVYISAKIMDTIVEGGKFAKLAYIISDRYEEIGQEIIHSVNRGVTALDGSGMYTQKKKQILMCVVSKKEIVQVMRIAYQYDKNAFVIISDIREVFGEGFVENRQL